MLHNHDFSGAYLHPRPQLNKILRPRPFADVQKAYTDGCCVMSIYTDL